VTSDEPNDPSESAEPLQWTLRVSVDGAQRLIHAWKDGRLEKTLGFPIEALQIHTPFTPTPGGGSPGPAPEDDSRPITLLPWDGITIAGVAVVQEAGASAAGSAALQGPGAESAPLPRIGGLGASAAPPPEGRSGSGAKKVAVASGLVLAALVAAWLARSSPIPEATSTAEAFVSDAGGLSVMPAPAFPTEEAKGPPAAPESAGAQAEAEGPPAALEGAGAQAEAKTLSEIASEPVAPALGGALPPSSGTESGLASEGVASEGEAGGQPRSKQGAGGMAGSKKAGDKPRSKRKKDVALYSHYQCVTEGAAFSIVVHGRNEAEAKANACGGSDHAACIAATSCERQ
jgi:hypothetical protein